jgi:serine/threonine-protein kinase RsbW
MLIELKNDLKELDRLNEKIESFNTSNNIPNDIAFKINLATEEIVTNIIKYGYENPIEDIISIDIQKKNNSIIIAVSDSAKEFNPLLKDDPDTTLSLNERKIGGLGIFFAKELMDEIEYIRENSKNILTMKKEI